MKVPGFEYTKDQFIKWRDFQINYHDLFNVLCEAFDIMEIRKRVTSLKEGIVIDIRPKEQGHNIPHIHARYQGEEISVSLLDGSIMAGNLSNKNAKIVVAYVLQNKEKLLNEWTDLHGITVSPDIFKKKPH